MSKLCQALIGGAALVTLVATAATISAPASAAGHAQHRVVVADFTAVAPTYQPRGYESLADYTRSIEGTPCGMSCTREQQLNHP